MSCISRNYSELFVFHSPFMVRPLLSELTMIMITNYSRFRMQQSKRDAAPSEILLGGSSILHAP